MYESECVLFLIVKYALFENLCIGVYLVQMDFLSDAASRMHKIRLSLKMLTSHLKSNLHNL